MKVVNNTQTRILLLIDAGINLFLGIVLFIWLVLQKLEVPLKGSFIL